MSDLIGHRLVNTFLRVKQRLESLLDFCRLHEHTLTINDDDWEDRDRFRGPYRWDIEELENSISTVSTLIANLQQEYDPTDDQHPIPNYPLCKNGWTIEQIERLDTERERQINLDVLALLRLQTLTECIHQLNSQTSRSHVSIRDLSHRHLCWLLFNVARASHHCLVLTRSIRWADARSPRSSGWNSSAHILVHISLWTGQ